MFQIPAWEDVPKTNTSFIQKVKKKEKDSPGKQPEITSKPIDIEKNNNIKINGNSAKKTQPKKRKSENNLNSNHKPKKLKDNSIVTKTIIETHNFDEILLNAKKKKFNAVIEKEDREEVLFTESNGKKQNKNNSKIEHSGKNLQKKNKKNNVSVNGASTDSKNMEIETDNVKTLVDRKKEKIKSILNLQSNRRHININKTGNQLRERMLERLKAAQFRYLNEKLYTSSGSEAQELFQSDPSAFETYHQGYQLQVKKWPVNPLDIIVKKIMKMPKSHLVADMGCGEAALALRVPQTVRSFDLVTSSPRVEACDMRRTPLLTSSVDVAVYCLALMGTDLTQYLLEANRVLKMGGHLLIAEVESRFEKVEDFTKEVERLGFKLKELDKSHTVFFFMEFTKIRDPPVKKAKIPTLTLKPCLYKRR